MKKIIATVAWVASVSVPFAGELEPASLRISVPYASGDIGEVSEFEVVQAPQFLLTSTEIDHRRMELYCSRRWSGVLVKIDEHFFALNDEALRALKSGMTATYDSAPVEIASYTVEGSPLAGHEGTVARLSERARKQCNPDAMVQSPTRAAPDSLGSAYALCEMMDASGILAKPCEVSGFAIKATIDVRSGEARAICRELVDATKKAGVNFERQWKIEIFSPFSGDSSIAYCDFS